MTITTDLTPIADDAEVLAILDRFCEAASARFEACVSPLLTEAALSEAGVGEALSAIGKWIRDFVAGIVAFVRRAFGFMEAKYEPRIKAAEARAADPAIFDAARNAAEGAEKSMPRTCLQVLSTPGWHHPTDKAPRTVYRCPGVNRAKPAVVAMESAFQVFYSQVSKGQLEGAAQINLQSACGRIMGQFAGANGYSAQELNTVGLEAWYTGKQDQAFVTTGWYETAYKLMINIERDAKELATGKPGEAVAGMFDSLRRSLGDSGMKFADGQSAVESLRDAGNAVVMFHNALVKGAVVGYQSTAAFMMDLLSSVAGGQTAQPGHGGGAPMLPYSESAECITEGLGSMVKNLATGDMEKEIAELKEESKDISTPEQQRLVITKIVRLLERLIQIRHSPSKLQAYVHDSAAWFQRMTGSETAGKELAQRTGEAIRDLAALRDKVLAKKWNDDKYNEGVDRLKEKVHDLLDKAASQEAEY